jgi:DNA topoisomerase-1
MSRLRISIHTPQGVLRYRLPTRDKFVEGEHPRSPDGEFKAKSEAIKATTKASTSSKTAVAPKWTKHGGGDFSPEELSRLRALKVRPDLTEIKLSDDPKAKLQVTGKDAKGRTQRIYSAEHHGAAASAKFARIRAFNAVAGKIVTASNYDMFNEKLPQSQRDAAAVIKLISASGLRIGSDMDTKADAKAVGASTLTAENVKVGKNGEIHLDFTGKSGVHNVHTVVNHELARYLRKRLTEVEPGDRLFNVPQQTIRKYMKTKGGEEFKVKDFRTWTATNEALKALEGAAEPTNAKEFNALRMAVGKQVSKKLGNTPTVALESYIDPMVFARWSHLQ